MKPDQDYPNIPPFPTDIPTAPLLEISLAKLLNHDRAEEDRLWEASCNLGFFYLDLRNDDDQNEVKHSNGTSNGHGKAVVDGEKLLIDAGKLFGVAEELFDQPLEEKQKYDHSSKGSYFGYKGYGVGIIDKQGSRDRNEFYNVSKDAILNQEQDHNEKDHQNEPEKQKEEEPTLRPTPTQPQSQPLPLPSIPILDPHHSLLAFFMRSCHAVSTQVVLPVVDARLGLVPGRLASLHRLAAVSGDQVRFVRAPPQPADDRRTAMGAHSDFGSVTVLFGAVGGLQVLLPEGLAMLGGGSSGGSSGSNSSSSSSSSSSEAMEAEAATVAQDSASQPTNGVRKGWDYIGGTGGRDDEERWAYVRPLPGRAIINLGDALVKFSAGILRSNIHRVVNPPGLQAELRRHSLVYFCRPEDEVVLKALDESDLVEKNIREGRWKEDEDQGISSKEWILRRALGRRIITKVGSDGVS